MLKKFIIVFLIFSAVILIAVTCVNRVILPQKIKALIIKGIEDAAQKKVSLETVNFNIFKGLVVKKLAVYDGSKPILSLKEASFSFLILPLFKKQLLIPSISIKSPVIFLERGKDNSFNITGSFLKKKKQDGKSEFNVLINKIDVSNGRIDFQDDTTNPIFTKRIENLNAAVYLSLPAKAKFNIDFKIAAGIPISIISSGEYNIPGQTLNSEIRVKDLSPKEFQSYYTGYAVFTAGRIDAVLKIKFKQDNFIDGDLDIRGKGLTFSRDMIQAAINSNVKAHVRFDLKNKKSVYSGNADIFDLAVSNLGIIEKIDGINGNIKFDNTGLSSDNVTLKLFGIPVETKIHLDDFSSPSAGIKLTAKLDLNKVQTILNDKFQMSLPAKIQGTANLSVETQSKIPISELPLIKGSLDIIDGSLKPDKSDYPLEAINGKIEFTAEELFWPDIDFKYLSMDYKTSGSLKNFSAPKIRLGLSSKDLRAESEFSLNENTIKLSKLSGKYLSSDFFFTGDIDTARQGKLNADMEAELRINLAEIKQPLIKFKKQLEQINPQGTLKIKAHLSGNMNDVKSCAIQANLSSDSLSCYGLKFNDFILDYNQENAEGNISRLHLSLYEGTLDASGRIDLSSKEMPYWANADISGIKIEKLKNDTAASEKDISGNIQGNVKISGLSNDLSKLNGEGKILVSEGKLWDLDLFKGIGSLLFTKDFTALIISEAGCNFSIKDKSIFTDNLLLKSNLFNIAGWAKIGFDNSLEASLNIVNIEQTELPGTIKDIASAVLGQTGGLGSIKIQGTLKKPKFKYESVVTDIFKGLFKK